MDTYSKHFFHAILPISMTDHSHYTFLSFDEVLPRNNLWNPKSVVSNNPKCDFNVSIFCYQVFCLVKDWGNIYGCQLEGVTPLLFGFWISHIHNFQVFVSIKIMEISLHLKELKHGSIGDRICCTCLSYFVEWVTNSLIVDICKYLKIYGCN